MSQNWEKEFDKKFPYRIEDSRRGTSYDCRIIEIKKFIKKLLKTKGKK